MFEQEISLAHLSAPASVFSNCCDVSHLFVLHTFAKLRVKTDPSVIKKIYGRTSQATKGMPWALVELDANRGDGRNPMQLQFLGRQRFTQSRKPIFKPAGFTPRGHERHWKQEKQHANQFSTVQHAEPHDSGAQGQQRDAWRQTPMTEQLRQNVQMHQDLTPAQVSSHARLALPTPALTLHAEREDSQTSYNGRVLPVKLQQRQPSPRINISKGAGGMALPIHGLAGLEEVGEAGGGIRSARRAAFTPRSQAQEDAKTAHRKSMVNGYMKRLMDKNWDKRKSAVEGLSELALLENDATVIDAVVQHLASKSDKARQAAIFAVSRIACFQANCSVAQHFLRLLGHSNPEVRQVAQAALGHVIPKGSEVSKTVLKDISALLVHHDRNMREAAVDAVVQVSERGDKQALECLVACFADTDRMVRQVALEATEQLLDTSLTSILAVLDVLRNICQSPGSSNVKTRIFASASPEETVKACSTLVARIALPASVCCSACSSASLSPSAPPRPTDMMTRGPFKQATVCGQCVAVISKHITQRAITKHYIAFCMGGHARLGSQSLVGRLDTALLPVILSFCSPNSAVPLERS